MSHFCCYGVSQITEPLVSRVRKLVRRRRPFNVFITTETSEAIAGVKTKLCTLHVEFRTERQWNGNQDSLPQISASCDQLPNAEDLLQVTEWQTNGSQSPQKTVYLNTEQAFDQLTLTIKINIQRVKNVFLDLETLNLQGSLAICKCSYSVLPSTPKQILVTSIPKSVYRGSTAKITAEIHDSFGNLSGDRSLVSDIKISSESLSTSSVKFLSRGLFQVMLKCNKIGLAKARIECAFKPGETQYSEFEFMVKCPPPSPIFSSILPEDVNRITNSAYEAGTAITFRVSVKDSFGHPIVKEDREVNMGIAFKKSQIRNSSKEISSLTCKTEDNSNIYFLTLKLRKDGERKLQLFFNNDDCTVQELTTITINVVPSKITTIQLECPQNNANKIFVNVPFEIKLNAFDRFGNSVLFHNKENQFNINITTRHKKSNMENKAKSKLQVDKRDGNGNCRVKFPCAGLHMLHVLLQQSTSDPDELVATDTTDVFVTVAPFSPFKTVVQELSPNLLVKAGNKTKFSVELYDVYANPVAYSDLETLNQKIPLEAKFLPVHHCHRREFSVSEENNWINLKSTAKTGLYDVLFRPLISGKRTLSITLKGESILNSPVEVNVVPSRLNKLQSKLIKNNPKSAIKVGIPQTLALTAYDTFENIIPFNDPQHPLFFSSNLRSINPETKKLQVKEESAYCSVTFLSIGRHTVSMLVRDCLYNVVVADKLIAYAENKTLSHIDVPVYFEDFEGVEEYEDDNFCILEYDSDCDSDIEYGTITCNGDVKGKIIGPDHSRLNNINRTIEWEADDKILEDDDIETDSETEETIVDVESFPAVKVLMIYGLILACLRGQHYREQGRKFDAKRQEWKRKSQRAFHDNDRRYAQECSKIKEMYSSLVSMCNKMASDEIFSFYNEGRGLQSIDLHELFAADEGKLREFYTQLLKRNTATVAMQIVDRARAEQDEAIEKLRERLQQIKAADEKPQWLEVIVGAGHHSKGKQKIKPKVIEFLKKEEKQGNLPKAEESNVGSLVVTFKPYTGPEPCFGYYFCKKCDRSWNSQNSWVGKYQCCYACHSKCYPMKQSEYSQEAHQSVNPKRSSSKPADYHYQDLCERCQELGRHCGY